MPFTSHIHHVAAVVRYICGFFFSFVEIHNAEYGLCSSVVVSAAENNDLIYSYIDSSTFKLSLWLYAEIYHLYSPGTHCGIPYR